MKKVLVGVSGGVDSSVAVHLLKQQGYLVEGVIFKQVNGSACNADTMCCSASAIEEAKQVCRQLDVVLHIQDIRDIFNKAVIEPTISEYRKGHTPSPCTTCNSKVRSVALDYFRNVLEFDFYATGHYFDVQDGIVSRGTDSAKDQSYMVALVNQKYFSKWLAPLGKYNKSEIRKIASEIGLVTATNPDSQDLCFKHLLPDFKRNVILDNVKIGTFNGRPTVGQKKSFSGLKVLAVDEDNIILTNDDVRTKSAKLSNINWLTDDVPIEFDIQLRSHSSTVRGKVLDNMLILNELSILTPGQVAAFYFENRLLGGAVIV